MNAQGRRKYYLCKRCFLIFVQSEFLPSKKEEKNRYLQHNNGIEYPGYISFIKQAVNPALSYIDKNMEGLDYGCGPSPVISKLLEKKGIRCTNYDPFFFPEKPENRFDFIFATETFEHFFSPGKEMVTLNALLLSGGFLIIMTRLWNDLEKFHDWSYTNDFTHVCFYHENSITFICKEFGFRLKELIDERVIILQKCSSEL